MKETYIETPVVLSLDDDERFEASEDRRRIFVDTVRVHRRIFVGSSCGELAWVVLTGHVMRFGRVTGRRPSRADEIHLDVDDQSLPPRVAERVRQVVESLTV